MIACCRFYDNYQIPNLYSSAYNKSNNKKCFQNYTLSQNNNHSGDKNARRQDIAIQMALSITTANEIRCISRVHSRMSFLADAVRLSWLCNRLEVKSICKGDVLSQLSGFRFIRTFSDLNRGADHVGWTECVYIGCYTGLTPMLSPAL